MIIPTPNYTQTPNDLFDHWLPFLGEGELKVLLVIMRKTFGWHKTHDSISISQLSKSTGMLEETVVKAAKSLQIKGVITREVIGPIGKQQTIYSLVVTENSNNSYPSVEQRTPLGLDPPGSTESQKKPLIKENIQKKQQHIDSRISDREPAFGGSPSAPAAVSFIQKNEGRQETQKIQSHLPIENKKMQHKLHNQSQPNLEQEKSKCNITYRIRHTPQTPVDDKKSYSKLYDCLKDIDIPLEDKTQICDRFSESEVLNAVSWLKSPTTKINKTPAAALKWACTTKVQPPQSNHDRSEINKIYAKKYDGMQLGGCLITVLHECVEIAYFTSQKQPFILKYSENAFMDQFQNQLRKDGFKILE